MYAHDEWRESEVNKARARPETSQSALSGSAVTSKYLKYNKISASDRKLHSSSNKALRKSTDTFSFMNKMNQNSTLNTQRQSLQVLS